MNSDLQIIRPKQLAKLLGISIPTLYRWDSLNQIPIEKIRIGPNVVGYRRSDVEKWLGGESKTEKA